MLATLTPDTGGPRHIVNPDLTVDSLDLAFLDEHGYLQPNVQFLTPEGLRFCRENIDRMTQAMAQSQPDRGPDRMISQHQCEGGEWLWRLIAHPVLVEAAQRQLPGIAGVLCWSTHLLIKPPGTGEAIPCHQDAPYWNMFGEMSAAVWIALDDVDEGNGTMTVVPGYHRLGTLPRIIDQSQEGFSNRKSGFSQSIRPDALPTDGREVTYEMSAGQMAMHHVMTPHSSPANTDPTRWRRVIVIRYLSADSALGCQTYQSFHDGSDFPREYFLLRGADTRGYGCRRSAFDPPTAQAPGYVGDPAVVSLGINNCSSVKEKGKVTFLPVDKKAADDERQHGHSGGGGRGFGGSKL